jgi:type I restriction enzyme S subunit
MWSADYWQQITNVSKGTAQPGANASILSGLILPVPPLAEQAEIIRRIEAAFTRIDRMTDEASRAAHLLDRLDERLLAKAFAGELVPQDPDDEPADALLTRIREARAVAPRPKRGRRKASA